MNNQNNKSIHHYHCIYIWNSERLAKPKICITGPLWGESTGDWWIPLTKDQLCGKHFHVLVSPCWLIRLCMWAIHANYFATNVAHTFTSELEFSQFHNYPSKYLFRCCAFHLHKMTYYTFISDNDISTLVSVAEQPVITNNSIIIDWHIIRVLSGCINNKETVTALNKTKTPTRSDIH